jgi:hypothetical protein
MSYLRYLCLFIIHIEEFGINIGLHSCVVPNKRQRISKGKSKMDNPEQPTTQGTQDEEKQNKNILVSMQKHK